VLHLRTSARKLLLLAQYGQWPHLAETSNSVLFLPAEQQIELKIVITFTVNVSSKNNCATILLRDIEHQTPIFDKCIEFLYTACGFSAQHILPF
jgi:hypothetical protein